MLHDHSAPAGDFVDKSATPRVAVIIIAWNRVDELVTCLESFSCVVYSNYEIVVIDNGSEDDTVPTVRERFPWVTLIANARNLGYVGGSNQGFRYALEHGAEYVFVLNQDTKMTPSVLTELVRVMQSDAQIAVAGAKNLLMENPALTWGRYGVINWGPLLVYTVGRFTPDYAEPSPKDVEWVIGNGCMMSAGALERIGPFDEDFFHLNEDVEWCTRARRQGYRVVYVDSAAILHKGSSSADIRKAVVFTYGYFMGRNAILFARRYAGPLQWAKLLTLMTAGLVFRAAWAIGGAIYLGAYSQLPFMYGLVDGFANRLRRQRITVRNEPRRTNRNVPLDRFLRWMGA
jgi:GT2 family glycosyltransferase